MAIPVNLVFEDLLSETVMTRMLNGLESKFLIGNSYNGRGFGYIKKNIAGFNQAAVSTPFFVLTDLDNVACAPELINDWLNSTLQNNLIFRIAVKEVESWLLADRTGIASFLGVTHALIPRDVESDPDPKQSIINFARRSRKRIIREDLVPKDDMATIGPNYNGKLSEFVQDHWSIERARENCDSLNRALVALEEFTYQPPANQS